MHLKAAAKIFFAPLTDRLAKSFLAAIKKIAFDASMSMTKLFSNNTAFQSASLSLSFAHTHTHTSTHIHTHTHTHTRSFTHTLTHTQSMSVPQCRVVLVISFSNEVFLPADSHSFHQVVVSCSVCQNAFYSIALHHLFMPDFSVFLSVFLSFSSLSLPLFLSLTNTPSWHCRSMN